MSKCSLCTSLLLVFLLGISALGGDTIYVDLSGIDTFPGLSDPQKASLKAQIIADIQANFDVSLGSGQVTISTDPADAPTSNRQASLNDDLGTHVKKDGSTGHHYGEWAHGSSAVNVHLKNFYERHADAYKTGGQWDLAKLTNGIGRTIAHELAHSYSVGHNENGANPSKMTEGGLVSSTTRANTEWIFDSHTDEVLKKNLGKKPCASTTDYDEDVAIETSFYETPDFPYDTDEYGVFDATVTFDGLEAEKFDFGFRGQDSDGGSLDGDSDCDFIYKASAAEENDDILMSFFEGAHDYIQFMLEGREGTEYEGQWFLMKDAEIYLNGETTTPEGEEIYTSLELAWDVDGNGNGDVSIFLNSLDVYAPYGAEFNGFKLATVPEPSTILLLFTALGALGLVLRRRK